jgi:hypothetical protein
MGERAKRYRLPSRMFFTASVMPTIKIKMTNGTMRNQFVSPE